MYTQIYSLIVSFLLSFCPSNVLINVKLYIEYNNIYRKIKMIMTTAQWEH